MTIINEGDGIMRRPIVGDMYTAGTNEFGQSIAFPYPDSTSRYQEMIAATPEYDRLRHAGIPLISMVEVFPLETALYNPSNKEGTITNTNGHLAILPFLEFIQASFDDLPEDEQPAIRGSSVQRASLLVNAPHEHNISDMRYRYRLLADQMLHLETFPRIWTALQTLTPQQREPFFSIESGRDWADIALPYAAGQERQEAFLESVFTDFLPRYLEILANETYRTHPQSVKTDIETIAHAAKNKNNTQAVSVQHDAIEVIIDNQTPLERTFLAAIKNRKVRLLPALTRKRISETDFDVTLGIDEDPDLVVSASQMRLRNGKFLVTRFFLGADLRPDTNTSLTPENHKQFIRPLMSIDIVTTPSQEDMERYDARTLTTYDNATGILKLITPSKQQFDTVRLIFPSDVDEKSEVPPIAALALPQYRNFEKQVELTEGWDNPEKNPVSILEGGVIRILWKHIGSELFSYPSADHNIQPLSQITIDKIRQFIEIHPDLTSLLQQPENTFSQKSIQSTLLTMFFYAPHNTVELLGKTGMWNLLRIPGKPDWQTLLERLNTLISPEEYIKMLHGLSSTPRVPSTYLQFTTGWEYLAQALKPQVQELTPAELLVLLYDLTNIGYNTGV